MLMQWTPERIRSLREETLRYSQDEFAQRLGVNVWTVKAWEKGKRTPRIYNQRTLEKVMPEGPTATNCPGHIMCDGRTVWCEGR